MPLWVRFKVQSSHHYYYKPTIGYYVNNNNNNYSTEVSNGKQKLIIIQDSLKTVKKFIIYNDRFQERVDRKIL